MRQIFLGAAILLMAGPVMASSIEVVGKIAPRAEGSIVTESCADCPPLQAELTKKDYTVPELKPGAFQASEVRDVGGEKKVYRTEGWMGGSPVVFVSKATPESMWEFYLAGSEMGFRWDELFILQIQVAKNQFAVPDNRNYIARNEAKLKEFEARRAPLEKVTF